MTSQSRAEQLAEKRRFWEQQIQQWKGSGLSQSEFCRLHNLKAHQLTYWKKRFDRTQAPVSLIELQLHSTLQSPPCTNASAISAGLETALNVFAITYPRIFSPWSHGYAQSHQRVVDSG